MSTTQMAVSNVMSSAVAANGTNAVGDVTTGLQSLMYLAFFVYLFVLWVKK